MWGMIATWRMAAEGISKGAALLKDGMDAGAAIETAIREVEDFPYYKSVGYGGLPNEEMEVELDAAFMDGNTLDIGAVAAIRDFANPISIARRLSHERVNSMLVAEGAEKFARKEGFERKNMLTERARAHYRKRVRESAAELKPYSGHDTVGAACLDAGGKMAAGTSTSGLFMKKKGRVGDSPVSGSGFYADSKRGAAAATGLGEDLMRGCISYEIVRLMGEGLPPQEACETAVNRLDGELKERRGEAGDISVVAMNPQGEWGAAANIGGFSFSVVTENQEATVYLVTRGEAGRCGFVPASPEWMENYMAARMAPVEESVMDLKNEWNQSILKEVDRLKEDMLDSILSLVKIDSVESAAEEGAPFGAGVKRALSRALSVSEGLGFDTVNLDNYIGYAQYGSGNGYVCAIGHVDVVPAGEGWKQPPFSGYMENGTVYSRGVLDNKGPVMACLFGLAALKNLGLKGKHPVRIIFGCDEETGFEDLSYYLSKEEPPLYGFTPDCKYPVVYSERGRAVVRIFGSQAELEAFFGFVNHYFIGADNTGDRLGIDFFHEEYGTMEMRGYKLRGMGRVSGDGGLSFDVTLSYPAGAAIGRIMSHICEQAKKEGLGAELIHNYDPVIFPKDGPMVNALRESYEIITGRDGTPVTTTGGTYAKAMPNIVPFGPSFPGQKGIAHQPNEWMTVEDLMTNARIYALALYRLSNL